MRALLLLALLAPCPAMAADGEIIGQIQEGETLLDQVRPGEPYPDLTFEGTKPRRLSDVEGIRVVQFWASWCGPCIEALPALGEVADAYEGRGVTVLALSVDPSPRERRFAKRMYRKAGPDGALRLVFATDETRDLFAKLVDVDAWRVRVPATAVIDGEGRLYETWRAKATIDEGPLRSVLDRLVAQQDALVSE